MSTQGIPTENIDQFVPIVSFKALTNLSAEHASREAAALLSNRLRRWNGISIAKACKGLNERN